MISNDEKAMNFLNYVAKNEKKLKTNLAKNITYNSDIFNDVFSETILKIYNTIKRNGTEISDYEKYFYLSSKFTYVLWDNRQKRKINREVRNYFDDETNDTFIDSDSDERERRFDRTLSTLEQIKEILNRQFKAEETSIYFQYMQGKTTDGCSYKKIALNNGCNSKHVEKIVKAVKNYIEQSDEIKELKSKLYADD